MRAPGRGLEQFDLLGDQQWPELPEMNKLADRAGVGLEVADKVRVERANAR